MSFVHDTTIDMIPYVTYHLLASNIRLGSINIQIAHCSVLLSIHSSGELIGCITWIDMDWPGGHCGLIICRFHDLNN